MSRLIVEINNTVVDTIESISFSSTLDEIVDCSVLTKRFFAKKSFENIVKSIIDPFNITLLNKSKISDTLDKFGISKTETAFSAIERLCRYFSAMPRMDGLGQLVVDNFSNEPIHTFVLGQNISSLEVSVSHNDRFSEYYGKTDFIVSKGSTWKERLVTDKSVAVDTGLSRYRPCVLLPEGRLEKSKIANRINWEAQTRAGKSISVSIVCSDFFIDNSLLEIGNTVNVITSNKNYSLIINSLEFVQDSSNTSVYLNAVHAETYKQNPSEKINLVIR